MASRLTTLHEYGQSVWLDFVSRDLLKSGELTRLIADDGLRGVTSNPSIFEKAIGHGDDYDELIREAEAAGDLDPGALFEGLAVHDIQEGADAMRPVFGAAAKAAGDSSLPRRIVCIQTNQGIMPQFFFPEKAGRDFVLTPYLENLAAHRQQITVFSGVSLPGVTGGHQAEKCFITGTPHPDQNGLRNDISLDQFAA